MKAGKRKAKAKKKKEEVIEKELILGLSGKQITVFLLVFMVVSAIFLAVWYYIGEFYQGAIFFFAEHILIVMGYTPVQISAVNLSGAYLGNFNLVPLVALAIATPKLAMRKRCEMLAIGIPLLFFLHVLDLVAHFPMYFYRSELAQLVVHSIGVGGVAMPFIIWFWIGYKDLFEGLIKKKAEGKYFCPLCGAEERVKEIMSTHL
ncbi:MAG: hypothetical protein U9O85_00410 [Euryarchaeota archaeon]|nr:hypothetical protein [Euryarchaeota archaeon]